MKSETEVRKILEGFERRFARNEKQLEEGKIDSDFYLIRHEKLSEVISVLKDILDEE